MYSVPPVSCNESDDKGGVSFSVPPVVGADGIASALPGRVGHDNGEYGSHENEEQGDDARGNPCGEATDMHIIRMQ